MAGDWLSNAGSFLTGSLSEDDYGKLPQAQGPDRAAYQLGGVDQYKDTMGGLASDMPNAPDLQAATQPQMQQNQALQQYLQAVALGQAPTAADRMFQTAAAQNARQAQSSAVSAQGMNPALAMRQMFGAQSAGMGDIAGKAAQQKLQQQAQYAGLAQQGGAQQVAQQMQVAERDFQMKMSRQAAQADIANGIFNAERAQTSYNVDYDKNKMAFSNMNRLMEQKKMEDLARSRAAIIKMGMGALTTAGGAALTATGAGAIPGLGMMGAGAGMMGGAAGGGNSGMSPEMLQMLSQMGGTKAGGTYQDDGAGMPLVSDYLGSK